MSGDKVVAASVQVADLLVQVTCLGGIYSIMDEAPSLCPDPLKEAPEAADQSDLERGSIESFLAWGLA